MVPKGSVMDLWLGTTCIGRESNSSACESIAQRDQSFFNPFCILLAISEDRSKANSTAESINFEKVKIPSSSRQLNSNSSSITIANHRKPSLVRQATASEENTRNQRQMSGKSNAEERNNDRTSSLGVKASQTQPKTIKIVGSNNDARVGEIDKYFGTEKKQLTTATTTASNFRNASSSKKSVQLCSSKMEEINGSTSDSPVLDRHAAAGEVIFPQTSAIREKVNLYFS